MSCWGRLGLLVVCLAAWAVAEDSIMFNLKPDVPGEVSLALVGWMEWREAD